MMRRGALADHPLDLVLRTAAHERLDGQIDVEGDRLAHIHVVDGEVALACWAGADLPADLPGDPHVDDAARWLAEMRCRALSVSVLASVLGQSDGWYHHHPLGGHPAAALWGWDVEGVLADAKALRPAYGDDPPVTPARPAAEPAAPVAPPAPVSGPSGERRWALGAEAPAEPLDPATWALIAAMAGSVGHAELVGRLGLSPEQADVTIGRYASRGLIRSVGAPPEVLGGRVRRRAG